MVILVKSINTYSPQTGLHINQDWVNSYGSISVEGSNNVLVGLGLKDSSNLVII